MKEKVLPEPRADEVRIKILTAGVSLADILMREGVHPESLFRRTPFSLGWDIVGTVDKFGEKVSSTNTWTIGHTVAALPIVGGYAQYLCLPSSQLVPVPSGLDSAKVVSMGAELYHCLSNASSLRSHKIWRTDISTRRLREEVAHSTASIRQISGIGYLNVLFIVKRK